MDASQIYILILLIALAIIAGLFMLTSKAPRRKHLTPLAAIAFALVIAGSFFMENRYIGYPILAAGVTLAAIDAFKKAKGG